MGSKTLSRRVVLATLSTFGIGMGTAGTTVTATERTHRSKPAADTQPPKRRADALTNRPGAFLAVVDRIVDEAFVVLLLEEDSEVIDQRVESVETIGGVSEGDVLLLVLDAEENIREWRRLEGETERRRRDRAERLEDLRL